MATKHRLQRVISSPYLGETKVIIAPTKVELEQKVAQQLARWSEQEAKKRKQDSLLSLEAKAERDTQEAQARLNMLRTFLPSGSRTGRIFQWDREKDFRQYPPFSFQEPPPSFEQAARSLGLSPQRSIMVGLIPGGKIKRQQ